MQSNIKQQLKDDEANHSRYFLKLMDQPIISNQATKKNKISVCKNVDLPDYQGIVKSGLLDVGITNSTSSLGFIFYGAKGRKEEELFQVPLIIWLNGGPGCSSQYGNFFEIGPLILETNDEEDVENYLNTEPFQSEFQKKYSFIQNKFSWSNDYNIIFIDQPIGTGISYAEKDEEIPTNQDQVAEQFYYALKEFYSTSLSCFNLNKSQLIENYPPLFIFGESYAGKYIPSIAQKIIKQGNIFNLKSIGIGDAFIAPEVILKEIPQYAYEHNLLNEQQLQQSWEAAQEVLDSINDPQKQQISRLLYWRFIRQTNPNNVDVYNISRKEGDLKSSLTLEKFFNDEQYGIRQIFNLKMLPNSEKKYTKCDSRVQKSMSIDFMRADCLDRFDYLLNKGLDIVVYNGDLDMIVPYTAPIQWIKDLKNWKFTEQFLNSETKSWQIGEQSFGTIKQFKNLSLYIIRQAGHMVPEDQREAALDLLKQTIQRSLNKYQNI
ncbi:serine carboxypeptidase family protein (macronuclear) [Tetrahymena thermophila SB210]|uniref:Carboxypeptidase n=1 Tax=Tetrahymena thermophila (strain SB210) TaxID=312017 RepID=I7LSZ5_TETTS|nr:serine carboxypeptidase family protein [Tetrahymena thermophila SB210]EAR83957.3 serine carboxypeptidase family protein [Tetrahymena thermophila SB210]|eukprot:XP_001031620.3 serine carboxypeptidase family protein [Tetrahymena thermophila SB210]